MVGGTWDIKASRPGLIAMKERGEQRGQIGGQRGVFLPSRQLSPEATFSVGFMDEPALGMPSASGKWLNNDF